MKIKYERKFLFIHCISLSFDSAKKIEWYDKLYAFTKIGAMCYLVDIILELGIDKEDLEIESDDPFFKEKVYMLIDRYMP